MQLADGIGTRDRRVLGEGDRQHATHSTKLAPPSVFRAQKKGASDIDGGRTAIASPRILQGPPPMLSLSRKGQTGTTRETSHLRRIMSTTHNVKRIIVGALLAGIVALAGFGLSMGTAQAFDPQPEPPGTIRGFDPQPDPPFSAPSSRLNPGVIRGFNPQPEPPTLPGFAS